MNQDSDPAFVPTITVTRDELERMFPRSERVDSKKIASEVENVLNRPWRKTQERRERLRRERNNELANTIRMLPREAVLAIGDGEINPLGLKDIPESGDL